MPRTREQLQEAAERAADWLESLDLDALEWHDATPLREVMEALEDVAAAENRLAAAVARARGAGFSWAAIGASLGVSREAARQRFGAVEHPPTSSPSR